MIKKPNPGVSRDSRISDEGLLRLEKHPQLGNKINVMVLQQWVRRYGDEARNLLKKYGYKIND